MIGELKTPRENGQRYSYFDKNGSEIKDDCSVRFSSGDCKKIYLTDQGELGTDATNSSWIQSGRAVPCEYGIYPLTVDDTNDAEVIL